MEHGSFLSVYSAKAAEYLLAIGYLLLFIPFWRYVQGSRPAPAHAGAGAGAEEGAARATPARPAAAGARAPAGSGWFQAPADVWLHPGHTWARLEDDGLVAVGADDFAHKLVGASRASLPALGDHVMQGEPALELGDGGKSVPMLSPVDGTVVAVNEAARTAEGLSDPYGASWLFKVKAPRLAANLRQLLRDGPARRMLADAEAQLQLRLSPALGHVLQDGGTPVSGVARALSGDDWDETARQFFLT
jgi:glycine cleavage system H lipoate-binding protein